MRKKPKKKSVRCVAFASDQVAFRLAPDFTMTPGALAGIAVLARVLLMRLLKLVCMRSREERMILRLLKFSTIIWFCPTEKAQSCTLEKTWLTKKIEKALTFVQIN